MAAASNRRLEDKEPSSGKLTTAYEDSDDTVCISLFSQLQLEGVPASTYEHKINQINSQIESNEFDTDAEFIQAYNLMTFCFWMVRKTSEAVGYNEKALQINAENIIALGNKAWIHEKRIELSKVESTKNILCNIKAAKVPGQIDPFLISETEIAYAYSRFGPEFLQKAMDIYTRVIEHVHLTGDHADVCRWKYEKALAARRLASYYLYGNNKDGTAILQLLKESFALADAVIKETQCIRLKARSWAILGEITQTVHFHFNETSITKQHFFPDDLKASPAQMLNEALRTDMHDGRVLETCARVYRYLYMRDEAIECLHKANEIRETTFSHHHLALALLAKKKKIELDKRRHLYSREKYSIFQKRAFKIHQTNENKAYQGLLLEDVRSYILRCPIFSNNNTLPFDEETQVILNHFEKSIEMCENHAALKDLGNLYGCLGKYEQAKKCYIQIIRSEKACSPSMLVTCYEQIGFCHLQLSKTASSGKKENSNYLEAIHCFFKAVEICASDANKRLMGTSWKSLPTLEELLNASSNDPDKMKKLADLYDRLGYYKKAISVYLDIPEGDKMKYDVYKRLIHTHIHDGNFDKAIYFLNVLKCSQESTYIEPNVYVKAYIGAALQSYSRDDRDAISDARLRFIDALFHSRMEHLETNKSDAFMIISGKIVERHYVEDIKKLLSQVCGLKITSTDDIAPGQDQIIEFERLANATHQQILVLDKSSDDPYFQEMIRRSSQEDLPPILVIKLDKTDTPDSLRIHHAIEYQLSNNEENNDLKSTENEYAHRSRNVSREVDFLKKLFYVMCGLNEF